MHPLVAQLAGTDRRSIGRADDVVAALQADPRPLAHLFHAMWGDDPVLSMRCADVVEKVTARQPELLAPFKAALLQQAAQVTQHEVRWHVAQLFSRLALTPAERRRVVAILDVYLQDRSRIVRTFAMQALADMALQDEALRAPIVRQLAALTETGSPAMRSRGRRLLARLRAQDDDRG